VSRCPHCLEALPRELADGICPRCGLATRDASGRLLTPLDVSWDRVAASQEAAFRRLITTGTPVAALVSLALPLFHAVLTPAAVASLMVIAHLIVLRLYLVKEVRLYLGPRRRFFHRWIVRLVIMTAGLWGYGLTLVPVAGGVAGAVTFASLTLFAYRYGMHALREERERAPMASWEKALLLVFALGALATLALLIAATVLLTWLLQRLNLFT